MYNNIYGTVGGLNISDLCYKNNLYFILSDKCISHL